MLTNHKPRIYVGTYGKYNDGSLKGKWVDLKDFDNYEEFMDYCQELHKDEKDPEFMFQDWEDIPSAFISETHIAPEFWDFMNDDDVDEEVRYAVMDYLGESDSYDSVKDDLFVFPGCDTMTEVAEYYIDEIGGVEQLGEEKLHIYFDYEAYGRDVALEWYPDEEDEDKTIYEIYGVTENDDQALGEELIEEMGWDGVPVADYFDFDAFGRAMDSEGTFISYGSGEDSGMVEIVW